MRRILSALVLLLLASVPAQAQGSRAALLQQATALRLTLEPRP